MGHPLRNFHPNRNQVAATDLALDTSAATDADTSALEACDGAAAALELRQLRVRETTERLGMGEVGICFKMVI